jgi:hypothetical protein
MRGAWVALLPMLLGGCVLPPAVAVASYAADGASYAVSDKSLSDHGISAVKNQDCATWHFFVGRAVCEDQNHPVPMASLDDRGGNPPVIPNAPRPQPKPVIAVAETGTSDPGVTAAVDLKPAFTVPQTGEHYLIIGSFADRQRAEHLAQDYAAYHAQVIQVTQGSRVLSRVVLGPLDQVQVAALRGHGAPANVAQPRFPAANLVAAKAERPAS